MMPANAFGDVVTKPANRDGGFWDVLRRGCKEEDGETVFEMCWEGDGGRMEVGWAGLISP